MRAVLALIFFGLSSAYGAEISLYAINSPYTLNWETPRSLLFSTARSSINPTRQGHSNHTIGHAYIGVKCDNETEILTGMTSGKGFSSRHNLFNEKHGMSVFLQDNPGHLQTTEEVRKDIEFYSRGARMSIVKFIVPQEQCLKAKEWYENYSSRPVIIYGGVTKRPLTGEGAGCTAYSMSYLEYADVDFAFFNQIFEQTIYIPQELLGGEYGTRTVPLRHITANRTRLSVPNENALEVKLYDPNRMYFWIVKQWQEVKRTNQALELPQYRVSTEQLHSSKVLVLELTGSNTHQ